MANVSITALGTAVTQNFDGLATSGTANVLALEGWVLNETGGGTRDNEQYGADTGGSNTGDTYSYGSTGSTDRALGSLRSGTLIASFGAFFTNDTGATITSLTISFTGEQWRLGTAGRAIADRLDFQINTATTGMDLVAGTWTDVDALDFSGPTTAPTGALNGNLAANRTLITATITGLNIPAGGSFGIRWNDIDATGADDGLAIDDFSLSAAGGGAPASTFSVADAAVAEGAAGATTALTFTVTRAGNPAGTATVDYSIANGTTDAADFAAAFPAGTLTFLNGETTKTITVQIAGDAAFEPNETFNVLLANATNAGITGATATGTITNDDVPGALAIAAASVAEGNAGTTALTFTVTRTGGSDGAVSATWTATLGTASADDLSGPLSGTVAFANGQTSVTITVNVAGDTAFENDETITVTLSASTGGATIATAAATGTILNDDVAPAFGSISIADASGAEGNSGTQSLSFTLVREAGSSGTVSVDYMIVPGSATAADLGETQPLTGTVTFVDGQTRATLLVAVRGDTFIERDEAFTVTLSNPAGGAAILDGTATGTITNDDSSSAVFVNEFHYDDAGTDSGEAIELAGPAGTDLTGWTLVLYDGTNRTVYSTTQLSGVIPDQSNGYGTLNFAYAVNGIQNGSPDGIALVDASGQVVQFLSYEGSFVAANGVAAGLTSSDVGVAEVGVADGFSLQLTGTGAQGADFTWAQAAQNTAGAINTGQSFLPATGTGFVRVGDVSVVEGNSGTAALTFLVTRSGGSAAAGSVDYAIDLGTVSADDIAPVALSGTLDFGVGVTSRTVTVIVRGDLIGEQNETLSLNLSNPTGNTVITDASGLGTITNDDPIALAIYQIQGAAQSSPIVGQSIVTSGIVTAINANAFWIQDPTGDGNAATSDAIQVFVGAAAPGVTVGQLVQVSGLVDEFRSPTQPNRLTVTQLTAPTITVLDASARPLPASILIGANGGILPPTNVIDDDGLTSFDPTTDGIDFWESLEGMRVTVQAPLVVQASDGRTTYIVASGGQGATGINDRGGITLAAGDDNPERLQLFADSTLLPGYTPNHSVGDILGDVTGILTYFAFPELIPTQAVTTTTDVTLVQEQTVLRGDPDRLSIASFNVENADPGDGATKFDAIAIEVVSALGSPDIIGLQEIQDADGAGSGTNLSGQASAQAIIDAIVARGGPTYAYVEVAPTQANTTGGEPGGNIRNGYLYVPGRVAYVAGSAVLIEDPAYSNSRRPLVAQFVFNEQTVTVVNAHATSRIGSDLSFGTNQPPNQAGDGARNAQGAAIKAYIDARLAADPGANIVALGDFNGYYFEQSLAQLTVDRKLTNLYDLLPVQERYSYIFEGQVQAFDNIIVTNNLLDGAAFDVVHYNSQLPPTATRSTDHDQPVATLFIPRPNTAPTDLAIDTAALAENAPAGTLVGTVTGVDAQNGALSYTLVDNAGGRFAIDAISGRLTTTAPLDREATATATVTVRVTDAGGLFYDEAVTVTVTNVNEAPTTPAITASTVAENAAAGTLVGTVSATDPEGAALRYSLADDAGGRFAIDATTGRLTTTAPLDFEITRSAAVTVRATDAGGLTSDRAITVAVTDINEAPTRVTLTPSTVTENAAGATVIGTLSGNDADAGDAVTFRLNGTDTRFRIDGTQLVVAAGAVIDFELERTIPLSITATDRAGLSVTTALTLTVGDVSESFGGTAGNDTLNGDNGDNAITGLAGNDMIFGNGGNDTIDGGDGADTLSGGAGSDRLTLGAGADQVRSLLSELIGDTIVDFGAEDRLVVLRSDLQRTDIRTSGSTLTIGTGALTLTAPLTGGDLMLAHQGNDSIITFHQYLATLTERVAVAPTAINGITNQAYLAGATSTSFTVQIDTAAKARFDNTLGVYEIDTATGALLDVRIIAADVSKGGTITVTGVEVGRQLGFFVVQDGADTLSSAVLSSTNLSFIQQNGAFVLANNGTAVAGATTFLSHAASANVDGAQHVVSGVASDGSGSLRIGFEDLLRDGRRSDDDFEDVLLTVQAVPQAHPVSIVADPTMMILETISPLDANMGLLIG